MEGKKRKRGRPVSRQPDDTFVSCRVSSAEAAEWKSRAKALGKSRSVWMRETLNAAIRDERVVRRMADDEKVRAVLADLLETPTVAQAILDLATESLQPDQMELFQDELRKSAKR